MIVISEHNPLEKGFSAHDMNPDKDYEKGFLREKFAEFDSEKKDGLWLGYQAIFRMEWKTKEKEGEKPHRLEGFARRAANLWLISRH